MGHLTDTIKYTRIRNVAYMWLSLHSLILLGFKLKWHEYVLCATPRVEIVNILKALNPQLPLFIHQFTHTCQEDQGSSSHFCVQQCLQGIHHHNLHRHWEDTNGHSGLSMSIVETTIAFTLWKGALRSWGRVGVCQTLFHCTFSVQQKTHLFNNAD